MLRWVEIVRIQTTIYAIVGALIATQGLPLALAQDSNFFLTTPGPLSSEHAKWDNEAGCDSCHSGKSTSNAKCLGCHEHKDLKKRIDSGKGYHSIAKVKKKNCAVCHNEHKGRKYNIMGWGSVPGGEQGFNHSLAGWDKKGKHTVLACNACHKKTNKAGRRIYLGADKVCGNCHKDDQRHGFQRASMMVCEKCHSEIAWKPSRKKLDFNHNSAADADFPQEGAHQDVSCGKCHPKTKFNLGFKDPNECRNCHKSSHQDHLFDTKACTWCHSPKLSSFRKHNFKHEEKTRFGLNGKHATAQCYDCHTSRLKSKKPSRSCASCHANDNPHRDRFKQFGEPPKCRVCHTTSSFSPNQFRGNHGASTGFQLEGKHRKITCRSCHRGRKPYEFEPLEVTKKGTLCMSCHAHKNVHSGEFTDVSDIALRPKTPEGQAKRYCLECHKNPGALDVPISEIPQHQATGSFPLVGEHAKVACDGCHTNSEFRGTPKECGTRCHQDTLHKGSLGKECSRCHSPGVAKFASDRFDHNEDTKFPLRGAHQELPKCVDCHPNRKYAETPSNCSAGQCHAKDDAHQGALGTTCENCHSETEEIVFDHNKQSEFELDGAHRTTECSKCHSSITFKPTPKTCYGGGACHPEPDAHKGEYGVLCEDCHNTTSFTQIEPLHNVGAFSLTGSHDRISCVSCHKNNRLLKGSGNMCINCHRQDDVHSNSLSPQCGDCHNQWSFAPARFTHLTVGCNLEGLHRTLPCRDCHKGGNFGALSPTCFGCHADTALRKGVSGTDHTGFMTCAECHSTNTWLPGIVGVGFGRESICR